jgi:WD40 repeat protein
MAVVVSTGNRTHEVHVQSLGDLTAPARTIAFPSQSLSLCTVDDTSTYAAVALSSTVSVIRIESMLVSRSIDFNCWVLLFAPESQLLLCGGNSGSLMVFDVAADIELKRVSFHTDTIRGICFSRSGTLLATSSDDRTVIIMSYPDLAPTMTLRGHDKFVMSMVWLNNDQTLVSGSMDHFIKVWDLASQAVIKSIEAHSDFCWSLSISADERRIASVGSDRRMKIWDAQTFDLELEMSFSNPLHSVHFTEESSRVLVGEHDVGVVQVNLDTRAVTTTTSHAV